MDKLSNAVRRFNSMLAIAKKRGIDTHVEAIDIKTIRQSHPTKKEINRLIRYTQDFHKITDFGQSPTFPAGSIGEERALKRINAARKAQRTKRINQINRELETASYAKSLELLDERTKLRAPIKTMQEYTRRKDVAAAIKNYTYENIGFSPEEWERYRQNYLKHLSVTLRYVDYSDIREKISNMSPLEIKQWYETYETMRTHNTYLESDLDYYLSYLRQSLGLPSDIVVSYADETL